MPVGRRLPDPVECRQGEGEAQAGQEDGELLASISRQDTGRSHRRLPRVGAGDEGGVPGRVAELVVEGLEVIDVHHGDREGSARLVSAALQPLQLEVERAAVRQAGQAVRSRQGGQLLRLPADHVEQQAHPPQHQQHHDDAADGEQLVLGVAAIEGGDHDDDGDSHRGEPQQECPCVPGALFGEEGTTARLDRCCARGADGDCHQDVGDQVERVQPRRRHLVETVRPDERVPEVGHERDGEGRGEHGDRPVESSDAPDEQAAQAGEQEHVDERVGDPDGNGPDASACRHRRIDDEQRHDGRGRDPDDRRVDPRLKVAPGVHPVDEKTQGQEGAQVGAEVDRVGEPRIGEFRLRALLHRVDEVADDRQGGVAEHRPPDGSAVAGHAQDGGEHDDHGSRCRDVVEDRGRQPIGRYEDVGEDGDSGHGREPPRPPRRRHRVSALYRPRATRHGQTTRRRGVPPRMPVPSVERSSVVDSTGADCSVRQPLHHVDDDPGR